MELRRTRSVGGIVIGDHGAIAMICNRNGNGAWLFPKGKPEAGENDEATARREIQEEAGLTDLELVGDLGSYERHPILPSGVEDRGELKEIKMFLFNAPLHAPVVPSMEIEAARWVPLKEVVDACGNPTDRAWFVSIFDRVRQSAYRD